jgi:predicted RNA binding protein YcfA (HicA-like mRNA interferase family)
MPKKIRDLLKELRKAGFELDRQKGSHRQFKHPNLSGVITLAGAESDDAKTYQERQIAEFIAKSKPSN